MYGKAQKANRSKGDETVLKLFETVLIRFTEFFIFVEMFQNLVL